MSYIIKSNGGEIIVIDGGYKEDAEFLIKQLKSIGGEIPTVSAWFLTHPHDDHIEAFTEILKNHSKEITVNAIYHSFPSIENMSVYDDGHSLELYEEFLLQAEAISDKIHIISQGNSWTFGNIKVEAIFVPNDRFIETTRLNNTSLVLRFEAGGSSAIFLSDIGEAATETMLNEIPISKLDADIVQMSHHGQQGIGLEMYDAISPEVCLWSTPEWLWNNDIGKGYNTGIFTTVETRKYIENLGVNHNLVAKNGIMSVNMPTNTNGIWGVEEKTKPEPPQEPDKTSSETSSSNTDSSFDITSSEVYTESQ